MGGRTTISSSSERLRISNMVEVTYSGAVATVWLNRPEKLNALNQELWDAIPEAVAALDVNDSVRVILVAGRGRGLTAGIDLQEFGPLLASGESPSGAASSPVAKRKATYQSILRMQDSMSCFANTDKPTIAVIHGHCLGAGMDLITACDMRLAAKDSIFSVRETKIAMAADVGTLQRLPRIINAAAAAEMIYTGRDFGAEHALLVGLLNSVHDDFDATYAAALALAEEIAANSPLAVQGSKNMLRANDGRTVDEALEHMAVWNAAFIHSSDFTEAVVAYLEKRSPDFTGE